MSIENKVIISIERSKVMHVVEGLSVTISQHNGGTPTYEQLWASESERTKLDIYYREAVGDLERRLMQWLTTTSGQFNLENAGTDYTLTLMLRYWPTKLQGLLKNKVQDYLVHSITAGWLNDFDGLTVKSDYQAIAGQDLTDIQLIIFQREFGFSHEERGSDANKPEGEGGGSAGARGTDADKEDSDIDAGVRGTDADKEDSDIGADAGERQNSRDEFKNAGITAGPETSMRGRDDVRRAIQNEAQPQCTRTAGRHQDNVPNRHHCDWTDWSGVGLPPMGCRHRHDRAEGKPLCTGHTEQEDPEVYMQKHVCGGEEHLCGHHDLDKLDW